ncbi:hypothetical protein [Nostoc sp. 'Peltigera membranacea cyanobiont' 210A]|uniref:hypothetical protein n=1 Tax=Nostoc sp. 'Peltigera membranacea cyanobiont' 210A TaxID=2014529 RepID=UPI00117BEA04|nr:hypothetical protein [Nostoc sp. 'Peltigera membranacea cyanobiont' 210A]
MCYAIASACYAIASACYAIASACYAITSACYAITSACYAIASACYAITSACYAIASACLLVLIQTLQVRAIAFDCIVRASTAYLFQIQIILVLIFDIGYPDCIVVTNLLTVTRFC